MDPHLRLADSSIDDSTKEEREVERLIDKKPAPSRKPKTRRAPKHDNRRRRMKIDDPDLNSGDKDMSLNYKSASLLAIAARIAEEKPKPKVPRPTPKPKPEVKKEAPKKAPKKPTPLQVESEPLVASPPEVDVLRSELTTESEKLAQDFEKFIQDFLLKPGAKSPKVSRWCKQQLVRLEKTANVKIRGSAGRIADQIADLWPRDTHAFGVRAGTIRAVDRSMAHIGGLPKSFVNVFRKGHSTKKNKELVRELIEDDKTLTESDLEQKDFMSFAALAAALPMLRENPLKLDESELRKRIDESTSTIYDQAHQVLSLRKFVDSWSKAVGGTNFTDAKRQVGEPTKDARKYLDEAESALRSFTNRKNPILPPSATIKTLREELKSRFGKIPPELEGMMKAASSQSSYGPEVNEAMPHKTASYHGVVGQGHPEGPTNSQHSIDKRHLSKQHYDSIVKVAKELLKEDWLQYAWEGGAKDAPLRAALDLAIHTADDCEYQSKIDAETYDMLLNRLAGWDHDTFVDTMLPEKRTAAVMENPHLQSILHVASELRAADPRGALDIVKGLRSMIASSPAWAQDSDETTHVAQDGLSEKDLEELPEAKFEMKDLKEQSKKLVDAKNVDDFMSGLKGLSDSMSKSASTRIASHRPRFADELEKLEVLEDMDDAAVEKLLEEQKAKAAELESKAGMDDIDGFLKGLDDMFTSLDEAAKQVETASVRINVATLLQIAQSSDAAFQVVKPLLLIAKKKMDKKKSKKTSQKKDEKSEDKSKAKADDKKSDDKAKKDDKKDAKKPPFGGKKAPPFAGKKAPPFKKKASDETITAADAEW